MGSGGGQQSDGPVDVLFVCVRNAGRSRMAEALFDVEAAGRWRAASAGTEPADAPHPEVVEALAEVGVELPVTPGRLLTERMLEQAGRVVAMGCSVQQACPSATVAAEDWGLDDPAGRAPEQVRGIRDEIRRRVRALIDELAAAGS